MSIRYLRLNEVAERYRVSRMTIQRWAEAGVFPKPSRTGPKLIRWRADDLDAYDAAIRANAQAIVENFQAAVQIRANQDAVMQSAVVASTVTQRAAAATSN